jgi:hypothetical protein
MQIYLAHTGGPMRMPLRSPATIKKKKKKRGLVSIDTQEIHKNWNIVLLQIELEESYVIKMTKSTESMKLIYIYICVCVCARARTGKTLL